jgi:hypothetical protein
MRRLLVPAAALCLVLTGCGIDDYRRADYPHIEARQCFQDAFAADRPAELTRVQYGDEGESIRAHFRVLGDARYEVVEQQFAGPPDRSRSSGWVRHQCSRFLFVDDPGAESRGAPVTDAAGECEQVEYVRG